MSKYSDTCQPWCGLLFLLASWTPHLCWDSACFSVRESPSEKFPSWWCWCIWVTLYIENYKTNHRPVYFLNQFTFHCRAHNWARLASSARLSFSSFSSSLLCSVTILQPNEGPIISLQATELPTRNLTNSLKVGSVPLLSSSLYLALMTLWVCPNDAQVTMLGLWVMFSLSWKRSDNF